MMIWQEIDRAQEQLFAYRVDEAGKTFLTIVDKLQELLPHHKEAEKKVLPLLEEMLEAMQNKDYLLVIDLLEFRLKPLMGTMLQ